jgi:AraC family transcriptional regulator
MRVVGIRHIGPYHEIGVAFDKLVSWAGPAGVFGPTTKVIGVYHDNPDEVPAEQLRSDACVTVGSDFNAPEGMTDTEIAGGNYAIGTHVGHYRGLGDAWYHLMDKWLPESGKQLRRPEGAFFEVYVDDCRTTPEEQVRTDLYVPIV